MTSQDPRPPATDYGEPSSGGPRHDAIESLEARLWDRARRNLRLLYNGGRPDPAAVVNLNDVVGPLAVANPKA